jgi:hypothetical protein
VNLFRNFQAEQTLKYKMQILDTIKDQTFWAKKTKELIAEVL